MHNDIGRKSHANLGFFILCNETYISLIHTTLTDSIFTVKSTYRFLKRRNAALNSNQFVIPQASNAWLKLWKVKPIPRHVHLLWRNLHSHLPVRSELFKRGINCSPLCCLCDQQNETIDHLFRECDWVKIVWFASPH